MKIVTPRAQVAQDMGDLCIGGVLSGGKGDATRERRWSVGCVEDVDDEEIRQRWRHALPPTRLVYGSRGMPQYQTSESATASLSGREPAEDFDDDQQPFFDSSSLLSAERSEDSLPSDMEAMTEMRELKSQLIEGSVRVRGAAEKEEDVQDASVAGRMSPADYDFIKLVGQGAFGKVFLVKRKSDNIFLALKVMRKERLIEKSHTDYIRMERDVLTKVQHPYIVTLRASFQTSSKLYLVLDFVNGGHLFFQLYKQGTFLEPLAALYAAEIALALSYLHELGIVHRDLKPENILLDFEGHVKVTDFGLAKGDISSESRTNSFVGTMEYMAPEILTATGHGKQADWWSLGILVFEMLSGKPPFLSKNKKTLEKKIVNEKIKMPKHFSSEVHVFLKGLLNRNAEARLGAGPDGFDKVKTSRFFSKINWTRLQERKISPPFIPQVEGPDCCANFDDSITQQPALDSPASTPDGKNHFHGFTYEAPSPLMMAVAATTSPTRD